MLLLATRFFLASAVVLAAVWPDEVSESDTSCRPPAQMFRAGDAVRVKNVTENGWHDGIVSVSEPLTVWLRESGHNSSWIYVIPMPPDDGSPAPPPRCREDNFENPTECHDLSEALLQELGVDGEMFGAQIWDIYRYAGLFYMFVALASIAVGGGFWRLALRGRDWKKSMTPRGSRKVMDLTIVQWSSRLQNFPAIVRKPPFIGGVISCVALVFMGLLFLAVRKQLYESSRQTDGLSAAAAAAFVAALSENLVANPSELPWGEMPVPVIAANPTYAELVVDSFTADVLEGGPISVLLSERMVLSNTFQAGCFALVADTTGSGRTLRQHLQTGAGLRQLMRNVSASRLELAVVDMSFTINGVWYGQSYQVKCSAAVPFSSAELEEYESADPWAKNLKTVKRSLLEGLRAVHGRGDTVLQRNSLQFEGSAPAKVRLMWMGSVLVLSLVMGVAGCLSCHVIEARKLRKAAGEDAGLKDGTNPSPEQVPSDLRSAGQPGSGVSPGFGPPTTSSL